MDVDIKLPTAISMPMALKWRFFFMSPNSYKERFCTCHPTTTKRGFVKGEALRLLCSAVQASHPIYSRNIPSLIFLRDKVNLIAFGA